MVFHEERRSRWVATVRAWKHSGLTQRAFAEPLASDLEFHLGAGLFLRFPSGVGPEVVAAVRRQPHQPEQRPVPRGG